MLFIVATSLDLHLEEGVTYTYPTLQTQVIQVGVVQVGKMY